MAQKVPSVVTDLYRISNKLNPQANTQVEPQETVEAAEPPAPVAEPKMPPPDRSADAHLKRRYGDFQRSRNDLLERLNTMEIRLAGEEKELSGRLEVIHATMQEIRQLLESIPADDPSKDAFSDRAELADLTLKIEKQRIEMIRMLPILEGASEKQRSLDGTGSTAKSKAETGMIIDSLGFRQVLRLGFAMNLPIVLAIILSAVIISIAIIGSFKGIF